MNLEINQEDKGNMKQRPLGITIFSIIYILVGMGIFIIQILFGKKMGDVSSLGISQLAFTISITFLGLLSFASGIGMWLGKKWGWWLGAFYCVYGVLRQVNVIIMLPGIIAQFGEPQQGIEYYWIKYAGRILCYSLLFLYFFKRNVREYFDLEEYPKKKAIFILIGVAFGIVASGFI
ncbi:MAG: hypothetical protein AB1630_12135, partial [bacterium]